MRQLRAGAVLLGAALVVGGCEGAPRGEESGGEPRYGGTVVIAGSHDLQHMNGLVADERDTAELLKYALFVTLVRLDSAFGYEPYLARSWEAEEDGSLLFRLRPDVSWHDGRPTTAWDVAFTFERVKDPETGSPLVQMFSAWEAVEVVDSFAVRFQVRPDAEALHGWAELPILPAHLLDTVPASRMRETRFNREPVGNGPFRFVSHRQNDRWVFEANPAFPGELGGRPYLDRVVWRVVPESGAQIVELLTGSAQMAMAPRAPRLEELEGRGDVRVVHAPSNAYAFVGWNAAEPPLDDARVRRALTLAIDRWSIVAGLRGGYGSVAIGPVPPSHWGHHPALEPWPHDPDQARALLDEAGWRVPGRSAVRQDAEGRPLNLTLTIPAGVDFSRDLAEVIQSDLAAVGVGLAIRPLEAATLFADIMAPVKRFQGVVLTLAADRRLDLRENFHSSALGAPFQLSSWSNAEADRLMDRLAEAPTREEAGPLWRDLQVVLHEEQPWTYLYYAPTIRAVSGRLRGVRMDARGSFVTLPRWWLDGPGSAEPAGPAAASPDAPR